MPIYRTVIVVTLWTLATWGQRRNTVQEARRLYDTLMKDYYRPVPPVRNYSDVITVRLSIRLNQLVAVDLKHQIVTTSVWLRHEWYDYGLQWNPKDYGDIKVLEVPAEEIWLPDIAVYNNADGNYEVEVMTKATLHSSGRIQWEPPVTFRTLCDMNVENYPFDQQICDIHLGSWSYPAQQLDLKHFLQDTLNIEDEETIDCAWEFRDFYPSAEWDILNATAVKTNKRLPREEDDHPKITFTITIRRKALFYIINIIIPVISITGLAGLTFYLPSQSLKKISLCISVLLSLNVFFVMLSEKIPPTAVVIPLLGKYLLFSLILVTFSVITTVIVLNIHFRTPLTHTFPDWAKTVFLEYLPKLMRMRKPKEDRNIKLSQKGETELKCRCGAPLISTTTAPGEHRPKKRLGPRPSVDITFENIYDKERARKHYRKIPTIAEECTDETGVTAENLLTVLHQRPAFTQAVDGVRYIAKKLRETDAHKRECDEWKYLAIVIDRFLLYLYTVVFVVVSFVIMLKNPLQYYNLTPIVSAGYYCDPWAGLEHKTTPS